MYTRIAEARDLHRLTEITVNALQDDPTFDYMWSYWRDFPEDNFVWWQMNLQRWLYDPKTLFLVTVLDGSDEPASNDQTGPGRGRQDTIVAYSIWERWSRSRIGNNRWHKKKLTKAKTWEQRLKNKLDIASAKFQQWSLDRTGPRRDANFSHVNALFDAQDVITQDLWFDVDELWNLNLLMTHRSYRRRGAASKLMETVMQHADEERVHCRVEASPMGKLLYESCEFKELRVWTVKADDDDETLLIRCMRRSPPSEADQVS